MPRKAKVSAKPPKQKTLATFFNSPSKSKSTQPETPPKPKPLKTGSTQTSKQRRVTNHDSAPQIDGEDSSDDGSDVAAIRFEPEVIELSDENASPRRPMTQRHVPRPRGSSVILDEEDAHSAVSDESDAKKATQRKKKLGKRKFILDQSDSQEEEEIQPRKRKLVKGVRPPSEEKDDDIMDEVDEHYILKTRMRTRNKKTLFEKNLEKMQRKKRGLAPLTSSESSALTDDEEPEEEAAGPSSPFAGAKLDAGDDDDNSHDESLEDDGFIVEDDEGSAAELPPEFSMDTHQDLAHHFKIICQLFVHLAVRPAVERRSFMEDTMKNTKYFSVPLQIARRKLSGLRDSLVVSSVWRPDFKRQLQKYPTFELISLTFSVPSCDACHLGGRISTLLGRVSGLPYDRVGFNPLDEPECSSSDRTDEEEDGSSKEFHLGRFCAKRTRVFHQFTHWEHALFEHLLREVDELRQSDGERGFVHVAFAKGMKPPEDLTDADGIMEWLDQRGVIDMEWQTVKELMESARNLEMAAKKGDDDIDIR